MHPNPAIEEVLQGLYGSTHFSTIDLEKGYHQIPIAKEDIHKTGFTILNQHYEYLTMPLGLCNAQKTFQRVTQDLLEHLHFVKIYLDDIFV